MNKYLILKEELETTGTGTMSTGGASMTPIFPAKTRVKMTYQKQTDYEVGDIVFCKCKYFVDAHLVIAKDTNKGYLIANNHGHQNGWTHKIYGRVIRAEWGNQMKTIKTFD